MAFGISTRFSSQEGFIGGTNPPSRTLTFSIKPKIHARIRHFLSLANSKKHFFVFLLINLLKKSAKNGALHASLLSVSLVNRYGYPRSHSGT